MSTLNQENKIVDIITFCEGKNLLNVDLFPWQKIILKSFYNGDKFNKDLSFTEDEKHRILTLPYQDVANQILDKIDNDITNMILVLGRRGTKDFIGSVISLYEVYKLIKLDVKKSYCLEKDELINIVCFENSECSSSLYMTIINGLIKNSSFLSSKIDSNYNNHYRIRFKAFSDIERSTVRLGTYHYHCRGIGNVHFYFINDFVPIPNMQERSDYFKNLKDSKPPYSKILYAATPNTTKTNLSENYLYQLYKDGLNQENTIVFQLPTYTINPNVDRNILNQEKTYSIKNNRVLEYYNNIEASF